MQEEGYDTMVNLVFFFFLLIDGGLEELNDEFSDGKVQFAYAKVIDPNTELPKFVFVGWVSFVLWEGNEMVLGAKHLIKLRFF